MNAIDPWITTYSGRKFYPIHATPNDVCIEDIAHGLSNICRYTGQCKTFYSVAEHSVRIARLCWNDRMRLIGLLHDAPEAYLNDVHTDVKSLLPIYMGLETRLLILVLNRYGLDYNPKLIDLDVQDVKILDTLIRTPEVLSLFRAHDGWELREFHYGQIWPWSPKKAEKMFLKMFRRLYKHE